MKKFLSFALAVLLMVPMLPLFSSAAAEDRPILTIGDLKSRTGRVYDSSLGQWQYLMDILGAEIQYTQMTNEEYDVRLANGNLPDIVTTKNNLSTILRNGIALNADPYLEECCPNLLRGELRQTYDVFRQIDKNADGFYFFPAKVGYNGVGYANVTSQRGYVVRWDYYRELGYPPISSEDDYLDVLLRMHENHPYTEEGYPTYLYGTDNFRGYETSFRADLSVDYWTAYLYQNNIFTNEVYDGYTDPAHSKWWTCMAWNNRLYRAGKADGSYDTDLFTQTLEQFSAKVARGQYLGLHSAKSQLYNAKVKENPDTLAGYAVVPSAAANYYTNVYQLMGNGSSYMWFISANSRMKETALRLFNLMSDPDFLREMILGRKGETWDYDADGVPRMTEYGREQLSAYKAGKAAPDNYYVRWGTFGELQANLAMLHDNALHPDGYPLDFVSISREYAQATMTNNISRDICEHYGTELPTDAFYRAGGLDFRNDCGEAISACISDLSQEQLRIISRAEEILDGVSLDLVLAETDEDFKAIRNETVRRLTELGEPEVFEAYRRMWDEVAAVIVPLVRQVQTANGVTLYTPEDFAHHGTGAEGGLLH